jgi:alanyl-tRNA synthetase
VGDGLSLSFFHDSGFTRQKCSRCKCFFWSTVEVELCGDAPCVEYSFIGQPLFSKPMNLDEAREAFLTFFEKKGHTRVGRASVVARWRNDIYLSIASIAVFQPHVTNGSAKPPANPLTISQPCIRLNDLESVGRSGRHLTTFEMMAHHAFNSEQEEIYWQNRTVELCHELYTSLGLDGSKITYKENPWVGGGNGGEALEVLAGGLELATLVFMDLEEDTEGDIELKGIKFRRMSRSIVDTGYGLERLVWASQGTSTIYEAVFPEAVSFLTRSANLEKKLGNSS